MRARNVQWPAAMAAPASADDIRDVNTRYHDAAAAEYDHKWGIDFHEIGQRQVLGKVHKLLDSGLRFRHALEIGSGTGYFSLNLISAGIVERATCTDISPGMLRTLEDNALRLGLGDVVSTEACDAEHLPFEDASFDLVIGHAVLHHLPDLDQAFREFHRVLEPGGSLFFAGEPSRLGDRIAAYPKRGAMRAAPAWRRLVGADPVPRHAEHEHEPNGHDLEPFVDVHAFDPA